MRPPIRRMAVALATGGALLSAAGLLICALQYWVFGKSADDQPAQQEPAKLAASRNPLELGAAIIFAVLFVATSFLSTWATKEFGVTGIYSLAAIVGISDIDPFVLNLAQGGTTGMSNTALAAIEHEVDRQIERQQQPDGQQHRQEQRAGRPEEADAVQEAQEQRRIA